MKKIIGIILCFSMLPGCSYRNQAKTKITVSEFESEISSVHAESIEFSKLPNKSFEQSINNSISEDIKGALTSFDTMVAESGENLRMGNRCILEIKQILKNNDKNFISVIEEHYVYTGGAHGSTLWYPRNIDTNSSKTVTLDDIFNSGYEEELNRQIDKIIEEQKEQYSDLWEHPKADKDSLFYITDKDIVIFFQPYELSYYARGFVEFPIKLSEIRGFLKDEYKRLAD